MVVGFRSRWQKIKQSWLAIAVTITIISIFTLIMVCIWFNGTGFNGYTQVSIIRTLSGPTAGTVTRNETNQPGKTLWDLMQLLIIPAVLAIAGFCFSYNERKATEKRADTEREIASDNQREAALQAYIDKMSELLLNEKLRTSEQDDEVRKIARVRTLSVLSRLDGIRKKNIVLFLHESGLIRKEKNIIDLYGADLREADFRGVYLSNASFVGANCARADFTDAHLSGSDLREANLTEANFTWAELFKANFEDANLSWAILTKTALTQARLVMANLCGANLSETDLSDANLTGADLIKTNCTAAVLERANLEATNLTKSVLVGANLTGASLVWADLVEADLSDANLAGANLLGANLAGVTFNKTIVSFEQLKKAKHSGLTTPDGLKHP